MESTDDIRQLVFAYLDTVEEDEDEQWIEVGQRDCPVCMQEGATADGSAIIAGAFGGPFSFPFTPPNAPTPTSTVDSSPPTMESLRKAYEDKVDAAMNAMTKPEKLIMYRQLYHEGIRFDTSEGDLRRELSRELKNA